MTLADELIGRIRPLQIGVGRLIKFGMRDQHEMWIKGLTMAQRRRERRRLEDTAYALFQSGMTRTAIGLEMGKSRKRVSDYINARMRRLQALTGAE